MTKNEALELLGLPAGASREQQKEAFEAAFAKARQELMHAHSDELKKKFQQRLDDLKAAQQALMSTGAASLDQLPVAEPVAVEQKMAGPGPAGFSGELLPPVVAAEKSGGSANYWLVGALIVLAAALTFFVMKYFEMTPKAEWHDRMNMVLQNGKFEIINRSELKQPYVLYGVEVFYIDGDTIAKRTFDDLMEILEPDRPFKLDPIVKGSREIYSGEVLFYSMVLGDSEGKHEPIYVSGVWPPPDGKGQLAKLSINYDDQIFIKKQ